LIGIISFSTSEKVVDMQKIRVMTLNLGGGEKNFTGSPERTENKAEAIVQLLEEIKPDVFGVQEISHYIDADGITHSMVDRIHRDCSFQHAFYGETLSMKRHMQVKKDLMVNGLFNDWWDWSKGNAIFSNIAFSRLSDTSKVGVPRNVPLFQPVSYEGSRDTDPRYVILTRLKQAPYPFVLNLHLTTLAGERGENAWSEVVDAARITRSQQIRGVISLVQRHVLMPQLPMILMGDFNATAEEYTLHDMLERDQGIMHLKPQDNIATHPHAGAVDHIYFFPAKRLVDYTCYVVSTPLSHSISDHLPVVADIIIQ